MAGWEWLKHADWIGHGPTACAVVIWVILTLPATLGVARACRSRFEYLCAVLPKDALGFYFEQWHPAIRNQQAQEAHFRQLYLVRCQRRHFVAAFAFSGLLFASLGYLVHFAETWLHHGADAQLSVVASGLAGGVAFVFTDQLARMRRRDFKAEDVGGHALRLFISVPFAAALATVFKDDLGILVGFGVGAFPTATLFRYARRIVDRKLQLGDSNDDQAAFALEALQGVGRPQAERLAEEGIQSVLQLAYTDPIELAVRTSYDFDYITDCVSQALLWTYTTNHLPKIQALGLRGAVEVANLQEQILHEPNKKAAVEGTLRGMQSALEVDEFAVRRIIDEVTADPYACFIVRLWDIKASWRSSHAHRPQLLNLAAA